MTADGIEDQRPGELIAEGRTARVFALGVDRVVKVLRPGFPEQQAQAEAAAARLADEAGIGAPRFHGLTQIEGRSALVYERRDGASMMQQLTVRPWRAGRLGESLGTLHAAMHGTAAASLPRFREEILAAVEGAEQIAGTSVHDAAIARVRALPDGSMLCHGDFHPGNVLMGGAGPTVIDWLTASSGPPAADVARTLLLLRDGRLPADLPWQRRLKVRLLRRRFVAAYLRAYRRSRALDLSEVARWRLPIMVARLAEGIEGEGPHLLRLIGDELGRSARQQPHRFEE